VPVEPEHPLTAGDLACLSDGWRAQLNRAAMAANASEAIALIEGIRADHPPVAAELTRLVNGFRFDVIMEVTRPLLD
jgi:hypothetical protein